jgi:uncharacterized DUF497 family protein
VDVEWDPRKAAVNRRKHGVDFALAATVFEDDRAITMLEDESDEERFVAVGTDSIGRILTVIYTWRRARPRLISARKASAHEREEYEANR